MSWMPQAREKGSDHWSGNEMRFRCRKDAEDEAEHHAWWLVYTDLYKEDLVRSADGVLTKVSRREGMPKDPLEWRAVESDDPVSHFMWGRREDWGPFTSRTPLSYLPFLRGRKKK